MPLTKTGKKKDGLMQYRVRINYTDNLGKPHQVERTAYGLEEAKQLETALMSEYKDKRTAVKLTVKELCDEYAEYHKHETRRTSHESTMKILRLRVLPYLADYRIDKLTQPVLADWKTRLLPKTLLFPPRKMLMPNSRRCSIMPLKWIIFPKIR